MSDPKGLIFFFCISETGVLYILIIFLIDLIMESFFFFSTIKNFMVSRGPEGLVGTRHFR